MSGGEEVTRRLSVPLLIGIYAAPAIFGWLTLRRGYDPSLRRTVLVFAVINTAIGVLGQIAW